MLPACIASSYECSMLLGAGSHGEVWLAEGRNGEKAALKISKMEKAIFARQEASVLRKLRHPNIPRFIDSCEEGEEVFIMTEYVEGGDLLNYLRENPTLPMDLVRKIFAQLLDVVEYAHQAGFVHRDIKLENILIDLTTEKVFLADWGFAGTWTPDTLQRAALGSVHYSAPEICRAAPYIGPEVDIWSLGVVLFALVTGKLPFRGATHRKIQKRVLIAAPKYPPDISDELFALINVMLNPDRALRATISQIRSSPFMTGRSISAATKGGVESTNSLSSPHVSKTRARAQPVATFG